MPNNQISTFEGVKHMTSINPLPAIIPNLPDDIAVRCIALLPLSSHPLLSLVSRSWRALFHFPLLFSLRSKLHCSEPILFISIRSTSSLLCFLFHPFSPRYTIHPIPFPPFPTNGSTACLLPISGTTSICLLGGSLNGIPTRTLQIYSPCTNKWSVGPSMLTPREFCAAGSIDGRTYVLGGCLPSANSWAECYDPTICKWASVPSPMQLREKWMHGSAVIGGKLLGVADRGGLMFDPRTLTWGPVPLNLDLGWKGRAAVVEGILYTYDYMGQIKGYDPMIDEWRQVDGLSRNKLPKFLCGATLSSLGGLLCLVWEEGIGTKMGISCAGIEICKRESGALIGSVKWLERSVVEVTRGSAITHCISVEL